MGFAVLVLVAAVGGCVYMVSNNAKSVKQPTRADVLQDGASSPHRASWYSQRALLTGLNRSPFWRHFG